MFTGNAAGIDNSETVPTGFIILGADDRRRLETEEYLRFR